MNPIDEIKPAGKDHRFDLLVDGELSETDRHELLSRLDDEPGGWRRCALKFLEAQAWRESFGPMLQRPTEQPSAAAGGRRTWLGGRLTALLAMAASFLVALFLGTVVERIRHSPQPPGPPMIEVAGGPTDAKESALQKSIPQSENDAITNQPERPSTTTPWRIVTDSETYRLPVVEGDRIDPKWAEYLPAPLPPDLVRELEQAGHRIHRRRELVPYRMPDGSRLVVPVDEYEVHYVGRPAL